MNFIGAFADPLPVCCRVVKVALDDNTYLMADGRVMTLESWYMSIDNVLHVKGEVLEDDYPFWEQLCGIKETQPVIQIHSIEELM